MSYANQHQLDNWYSYHVPSEGQAEIYEAIRSKARELAELFDAVAPSCADTTYAHRELRNTVMAMNLAIACNATSKPAAL